MTVYNAVLQGWFGPEPDIRFDVNPAHHPDLLEARNIKIVVEDERHVTTKQRKFAYAIMADIASAGFGGRYGETEEQVKGYFYYMFSYLHDEKPFSLSLMYGNRSDANEFIDMLLEFCFAHDIGLRQKPIETLEGRSIYKYEYLCLMHKKCVICGKKSDLHHLTGSKVGIGNNRNHVNHMGRLVMALCREHHNKWHERESELMDKYHLNGVKVDERIAKFYRLHTDGN